MDLIIALDVDGTLDVGDPTGPIKLDKVAALAKNRNPLFVVISDSYQKVWNRTDLMGHILAVCVSAETKVGRLKNLKEEFPNEDRYIMVGDSEDDISAAQEAGYEYMTPEQFLNLLDQLVIT